MTTKALIVLSGGQDSTTAMFMAKEQGHELHAISFDYGQRHRREIVAATTVGLFAGCKTHEVIDVRNVLTSTSPLVDHNAQLEQYNNHEQMEQIIGDRVELTFVPMRNALFLTIAANRYTVTRQIDSAFHATINVKRFGAGNFALNDE